MRYFLNKYLDLIVISLLLAVVIYWNFILNDEHIDYAGLSQNLISEIIGVIITVWVINQLYNFKKANIRKRLGIEISMIVLNSSYEIFLMDGFIPLTYEFERQETRGNHETKIYTRVLKKLTFEDIKQYVHNTSGSSLEFFFNRLEHLVGMFRTLMSFFDNEFDDYDMIIIYDCQSELLSLRRMAGIKNKNTLTFRDSIANNIYNYKENILKLHDSYSRFIRDN